ncbi:MAG: ribonuclease HI [Planctomycetaceae bacterium]|nr:MAG: ribonuclease HI [Planctomycetaceae bacterium]
MSQTSETTADLKEVTIHTDGGAVPNPGRGGFGVVLRFGKYLKELSGGFALTTNNRMELMAVIVGLEALKERCRVRLHSDSKYIVDAITTGAAFRWRDHGWSMKALGSKKAKNADLWERLLAAYDRHAVEMVWVKGHAGVDDNERCDRLAAAAMQQPELPPDEGYDPDPPVTPAFTSANRPQTFARSKTKMTEVGQPCRKCGTPIIKRTPKKQTVKTDQAYYYAWYLYCPGCKSMYMVEDAKRHASDGIWRLPDE